MAANFEVNMISSNLSWSSLTNPNNFLTIGYLSATFYLGIVAMKECYECKDLATSYVFQTTLSEQHSPENRQFAQFLPHHIGSLLCQGLLAIDLLMMSQTPIIQKSYAYISRSLGTKFLPSAKILAASLLILKVVDISSHIFSFSSDKYRDTICNLRRKLIRFNFVISAIFLTTFALTALTQFQNWKEGVAAPILFVVMVFPFKRVFESGESYPWDLMTFPHLTLSIAAVAGKCFTKLSWLPKAEATFLIAASALFSIVVKAEDSFDDSLPQVEEQTF